MTAFLSDRRMTSLLLAAFACFALATSATAENADARRLRQHVDALRENGEPPLDFVLDALENHDLILFDDALHNAVEPWTFYGEMARDPRFREKAKYIFLEVIPVNRQGALDAYFSTFPEDQTLLYPAFQDRYGWAYKTYFDFLHTVWEINKPLKPEDRLIVRAVSTPSYWKEMETHEDWMRYNDREVIGRDYDMYKIILADLDVFDRGKKGVFLTNTRHAYTNVRNKDGAPFWNTGTFFRQWNPGKAYSIRFNAPILKIESQQPEDGDAPRTGEGLERYRYAWARVENGLWDAAFKDFGETPVAVSLYDTPFGYAAYMGNHMHKAAPNQIMRDAYDAVIFLAPFEHQHSSAHVDFIYTPAFKQELARRYHITHTPAQLRNMLAEAGAPTLDAYIGDAYQATPETLSEPAQSVGDMDAWRRK